jgi:hypothetical protein
MVSSADRKSDAASTPLSEKYISLPLISLAASSSRLNPKVHDNW